MGIVGKQASIISPGPPRKSVGSVTELVQKTVINVETCRMGASTSPGTCVEDICRTLYESPDADKPCLADEKDVNDKHYLFRADTIAPDEPQSETLAERLASSSEPSPSGSLSRKDVWKRRYIGF